MEAKEITDIIDTADCNVEACFVASDKTLQPLGWARKLIEISFEAGFVEGQADKGHNEAILRVANESRKAGRKEVAEWVMGNAQKAVISSGQEWTYELEDDFMKGKEFDYYLVHIYPESWQAKKKEWGIE